MFHEVQERGGYDVVTSLKLWKDVCRTLNVDLKGQTSASYNMRLNYEKCLLDFEHYLSSGRYTQELQNGTAPSCTIFETFPQRLREFELEALMARGSGTILEPDQIKTRGARRSRETVSMTQLLIGEAQAKDQGHRLLQKTAQKPFQFERRISPNQHKGTSQSAGGDAGRAILPPVAHGLPSEFESLKRVDYHRKDPVEIQPGESIGLNGCLAVQWWMIYSRDGFRSNGLGFDWVSAVASLAGSWSLVQGRGDRLQSTDQ